MWLLRALQPLRKDLNPALVAAPEGRVSMRGGDCPAPPPRCPAPAPRQPHQDQHHHQIFHHKPTPTTILPLSDCSSPRVSRARSSTPVLPQPGRVVLQA